MSATRTTTDRAAASARTLEPSASAYTVAQIAARWGVKPHLVLQWIKNGELRAIDIRAMRTDSSKPRWKIQPEDLAAFETARAAKPQLTPSRRRQKSPGAQTKPIGRRW